jgi:hypothetical protein
MNKVHIEKTQYFTLISNPMKKLDKSTQKKFLAENLSKLVKEKRANSKLLPFFENNFLIATFSRFSQWFRNQHKILRFLISYI